MENMNKKMRMRIDIEGRTVDDPWVKFGVILATLSGLAILIGLFVFVILPLLGVALAIFLGVFAAALVIFLVWLAYIRLKLYWMSRRYK
jgi:hypothetical protein